MGNSTSKIKVEPQSGEMQSLSMLGEELHGITDYYIIKDEESATIPSVIMLLGEVHGKQTCGESDYVSAYKRFLDYNQSNNKVQIDIFIESVNVEDNLIINNGQDYKQWMSELQQFFQDCVLYYQRDSKKCKYTTVRFHWSDPRYNKEEWLDQGKTFPFTAPDNWRVEYPEISKHLQTKDDLIKIILENSFIRKNGERCKIPNWEQLVRLQFDDIYKNEFIPRWIMCGWRNEDEWWKHGIYYTFRLVQDVYVFLRMFRHPRQQLEKWEEINRFQNIIYHAGANHIQYIKRMLLNYGNFRVLRETHSTGKQCTRVNFMDFLNIIEERDEHSVYNSHQGQYNDVHDDDDYTRMLSGNMSGVGVRVGGRIKKRHSHFRYKSQKKCNSRRLKVSCRSVSITKRSFCRRRTNKNYRS
jgi:hypothetical protein